MFINIEALLELIAGDISIKDPAGNHRSKLHFTLLVAEHLSQGAAKNTTRNLDQLRDDVLNSKTVVFVDESSTSGKTIDKERLHECKLVTRFTDGTYRVIEGSNDGEIETCTHHTLAELEDLLR
jgi:hypothetical protein